jgi:hypothetical protein
MAKRGYLASLINVPPLIFRFQFNPDILNIKKSFNYQPANSFGQWGFDRKTSGAAVGGVSGFFGGALGLYDDFKEWGSLLSKVKPLEAKEGEPQVIALEFKLDRTPSANDLNPIISDPPNTIEPDIAILQSFMYPSWDIFELFKAIIKKDLPCPTRPPECSFAYGGISINCVMTDLNIKITQFAPQSDPDIPGKPVRADVDITLKEQTFSLSPISQLAGREIGVVKETVRRGLSGFSDDVKDILNPFS